MKKVLILFLLLTLLTACSRGPDRCSTDKALLEDNFNDTACGWDTYDEPSASAGYATSEYYIAIHQANTSAVAVPGATFHDVSVQVDARLDSGASNNNLGLLCRYQGMENFYAFLISNDGFYAIASVIDNSPVRILSGDGQHLMQSDAIKTEPGAVNEIRALCTGNQLTLFVNDQQLASVSDDQLTEGDIGFIVSSYEEGSTKILFDNLVVNQAGLDPSE